MSSSTNQMTRLLGRKRWLICVLALSLSGVAWAADVSSNSSKDDAVSSGDMNSGEEGKYTIREGTVVKDLVGTFRISGDRAEFTTENGVDLGGLENLALERIVQTTADNQQLVWSVSGTIMEYQGNNFILVSHAVVKTRGGDRDLSTHSPRTSQP